MTSENKVLHAAPTPLHHVQGKISNHSNQMTYTSSPMALEKGKVIDSMDLEWDVSDFSFADDEGINQLDSSASSDAPLYYSIVDFSPEEVFMNGNPKSANKYRKKELKIIVVVRLLEGNDESLDLFLRKDDLQIAIEYGTRANTWVEMLPLHALSINTYKVMIDYEMLHKYVGKQVPKSVLENDVHVFDLKLYLVRKRSNGNTQSECIACSDKFVLKVHYSNYKSKSGSRVRNKKRVREKADLENTNKDNSFHDVSSAALSTRQLKVRVIESMTRLSSVNNQGDNIFDQLESLNDEQLHQMTENMVEQVVSQLSDIADKSSDCQLRKELLAIDENGYSLLHILCINNSPSCIATVLKVIQKDGANAVVSAVNTPSKHGIYPLHIAALNGYIECARELIKAGAGLNARDRNGLTAYDIASKAGYVDFASMIHQMHHQTQNNPMVEKYLQSLECTSPTYSEHGGRNNTDEDQNSVGDTSSPSSTRGILPRSTNVNYEEENKAFLADALQNLSLQDKCALKIGLETMENKTTKNLVESTSLPKLNNASTNFGRYLHVNELNAAGHSQVNNGFMNAESSGNEEEIFSDVASVLSEADIASVISNESEQLDIVISAMNSDEKEVVDEEVVKIQKNVKRWLMQKNFETIRAAAKKLSSRRTYIVQRFHNYIFIHTNSAFFM